MITHAAAPCADTVGKGLERTRYFGHQLVGPDDLTQDQDYFREKLRRHNRVLHGWGVVCGACVRRGVDPCEVVVDPGYILGPYGDEIVIDAAHALDVCGMDRDRECGCCGDTGADPWCADDRQPCDPGVYYLAVRYVECFSRPVRHPAGACAPSCEGECEYSRIREGYELTLLSELPEGYTTPLRPPGPEVLLPCRGNTSRSCPPCPPSPWVVLADVHLGDDCAVQGVDCFRHRRFAVSSASFFQVCVRDQKYPPTHRWAGDVTDYVTYMAATSDSNMITDVVAASGGEQPRATVLLVRRDESYAALPGYFEIAPGETMGDVLEREGGREFFDPVSAARFTLGELAAAGAVDLDMPVSSTGHALSAFEGLEVDLPALRRAGDAVAATLSDEGLQQLRTDHGGHFAGVAELPGSALTGVDAASQLGKKLSRFALGDIAAADREVFIDEIVRGTRRANREANRALAADVWERVGKLVNRTRGLAGPRATSEAPL